MQVCFPQYTNRLSFCSDESYHADGSGCIRFETACLKIIDMKPRGIESAPSEDEDEMDTTAVLLPTGEGLN